MKNAFNLHDLHILLTLNTLRAAVTLCSLLVFVGIAVWAYAGRNRDRFEAMAATPLWGGDLQGMEGDRHE